MKPKTILAIVVAAVIVIGGIIALNSNSSTSQGSTSVSPSPSNTVQVSYSMADVAKHANGTSCWTAINGGVYDVTSWINEHPGGAQAILSICGIDGSAAFNGQHGGQRRPEQELAGFQIGTLSK